MWKGGKWTTVRTTSVGKRTLAVYGLRAKTTYKFRMYSQVPAANGKPALVSAPTRTFSVKTAPSAKPSIKSVKIRGAKVRYVKKVWHSGYWNGLGKWVRGYYTGGYYYTTYKARAYTQRRI